MSTDLTAARLKNYRLERDLKIEREARALVLAELSKIRNLQAASGTSSFGPTPLEYIAYYESIQNEVEKSFFFQRTEIETGLRARDWQEIRDQEGVVRAATAPKEGSLSWQLEQIPPSESYRRHMFYEKHKDAIAAEVTERQEQVTALRLAKEPATLSLNQGSPGAASR
jgi:hypothetical protein